MSDTQIIEARAVETGQVAAATPPPNSPMGMMLSALQQGATLDQVEKMMDLQERWEANEARKAYNDAMAAFKAEAVEIIKRKQVDFQTSKGRTTYKHAELADVVEAVAPALSKHGFSWSWMPHQERNVIRVTCTLKHRLGHSESVTLEGPPDETGGKNAVQAIISTKTYLERHTLKAICGLAEKGEDDDGRGLTKEDQDVIDDWIAAAEGATSIDALNQTWQDGLREIQKTNDLKAYERFRAAYQTSKQRIERGQKR